MKNYFSSVMALLVILAISSQDVLAGSKWVRLSWQSDASSEATITYSPDGSHSNPYVSFGYTTNESGWTNAGITFSTSWGSITNNHVRLTNLTSDSEVYFRICDNSGCGQRFYFKTAPTNNSSFVFVAGGDTRTGWTNRQNGNRLIAKIRPLFVMHGGDYTDSNSTSQWQQWLIDWELSYSDDTIDGYAYKRIYPMIATHGNHEDGDISTICKMLGFDPNLSNSCSAYDTYYGVDVSPLLRVFTLNSQFMSQSSTLQNAQNSWLSSELSSSSSVAWRVAQYHKPMFPHYSGKSDNPDLFNWWAQDFYDYGLNLVVESDTHMCKLTEVVEPSGNGFIGSAQGVTAGTVYVGEGSWGAPARSANDAKSWTVDMASIQQFKVVTVSDTGMDVRTAQFDSSASSLTKAQRDADATVLPTNVNWWSANGVGETLMLETDSSNRTVLAGSSGGGNGTSTTLSATDDTFISSNNASTNYDDSSEQLLADASDSQYGVMQALIKWDLSSIASCATVEGATIQLNVFNHSTGSYNIFTGVNSWDEYTTTWNSVGGTSQQGTNVGSFSPGSTGTYNILLNAAGVAAVQNWVQGSSNHGVIIASGGTVDGIDFSDRETGPSPKLIVTYNEDQCGSGNSSPVASFNFVDNFLDVDFTDTSTDSDGSIVSWLWNFGDGNSSSQQNPSHTYNSAGLYTVTLTVNDDQGAQDSTSTAVNVTASSTSTTVELQQGLNGYTGAQDTYVAEGLSTTNYGNDNEILSDRDDGSRDELISLLKWDVSSIPANATVTEVKITLNVFNPTNNTYNLWDFEQSWSENSATWSNTNPENNRGAKVGSFAPTSTGTKTIALDANGRAMVERWISGGANDGISIESNSTNNGIDMRSSEYSTQSLRPKLTVTYTN